MESLGLKGYLSIRLCAMLMDSLSTSMNSRLGKPRSFLPMLVPSSRPLVLVNMYTTSSHVRVEVYALISPFSICRSSSLAFFDFSVVSGL